MKASAAWSQKEFEPLGQCAACVTGLGKIRVYLGIRVNLQEGCGRICVMEWQRLWKMWKKGWPGGGICLFGQDVGWGVATSAVMASFYWYGVVLVVAIITAWDSDGQSEHGEWFEGGRGIVYTESVVGVGGFSFLLSLYVPLYSEASYNFETAPTIGLCWFSRYELPAPFVLCHYPILTNIT
jgi:hypothetical protein